MNLESAPKIHNAPLKISSSPSRPHTIKHRTAHEVYEKLDSRALFLASLEYTEPCLPQNPFVLYPGSGTDRTVMQKFPNTYHIDVNNHHAMPNFLWGDILDIDSFHFSTPVDLVVFRDMSFCVMREESLFQKLNHMISPNGHILVGYSVSNPDPSFLYQAWIQDNLFLQSGFERVENMQIFAPLIRLYKKAQHV